MKQMHILWVDDEIDLLKPFILFLEERNYLVDTCNNGTDAIEKVVENKFDLVILDEMMPGLDGLATLQEIKRINPALPIVMVTKSEEEGLMDKAIASQISDYLIKPINPNQTKKQTRNKSNNGSTIFVIPSLLQPRTGLCCFQK